MLFPLSLNAHGGSKKKAEGKGIVHSIDIEKETVNLTTEPIDRLGWSKMTMDWRVAEGVQIHSLKKGDYIHFSLKEERRRLNYYITDITLINQNKVVR